VVVDVRSPSSDRFILCCGAAAPQFAAAVSLPAASERALANERPSARFCPPSLPRGSLSLHQCCILCVHTVHSTAQRQQTHVWRDRELRQRNQRDSAPSAQRCGNPAATSVGRVNVQRPRRKFASNLGTQAFTGRWDADRGRALKYRCPILKSSEGRRNKSARWARRSNLPAVSRGYVGGARAPWLVARL
jgi:hypothetical protein